MTRLVGYERHGDLRLGCLAGGRVIDVEERLTARDLPAAASLADFISRGAKYWTAAEAALRDADEGDPEVDSVRLGPPLRPGAILCGGANFHNHLAETGRAKPDRIEFFFKSPTTVVGPRDEVRMDPTLSAKYDYEVELGVVIGRRASNVEPEDALSYVFGYLVLNDVSIRDHQIVLEEDGTSHGRFGPGKNFQDACPIGPCVVTTSEIHNPGVLELETRVDGELRQRSDMRQAIWSVPELVAYYSTHLTLQPGWIIAAGTPGGPALGSDVELRAKPHRLGRGVVRGGYVQPGQVVECRIEGIGSLSNRYVVKA